MSDNPVRTWLETDVGRLDFQTYFVKNSAKPVVRAVELSARIRRRRRQVFSKRSLRRMP